MLDPSWKPLNNAVENGDCLLALLPRPLIGAASSPRRLLHLFLGSSTLLQSPAHDISHIPLTAFNLGVINIFYSFCFLRSLIFAGTFFAGSFDARLSVFPRFLRLALNFFFGLLMLQRAPVCPLLHALPIPPKVRRTLDRRRSPTSESQRPPRFRRTPQLSRA